MPAFNLLPPDLTPKKEIIKISRAVKKISVLGYTALLITTVVLLGVFIMLSKRLDVSIKNQDELKSTITSLKNTEQKLVLIKDRINKAERVLGAGTSTDEIENYYQLLSIFPDQVYASGVKLSTDNTEISLTSVNSSSLAEFLSKLMASGIYEKIILRKFEFMQEIGYRLLILLEN